MTIRVSAFAAAPRSGNSRHVFGVGEAIVLEASGPMTWLTPGSMSAAGSAPQRSIIVQYAQAGSYTITAQGRGAHAGSHVANVRVVAPRMQYEIDPRPFVIAPGSVGAGMFLRMSVTPMEVSFQHLRVRERHCDAVDIWGYFDRHREQSAFRRVMHHDPLRGAPEGTPEWKTVDAQNRVVGVDAAGFAMAPADMNWPIVPGGFTWRIPLEYQIDSQAFSFENPVGQAIRISPEGGSCRSPFHGTVTLWKGGQRKDKQY